jgi:hypothetical protein
VSNGYEEYLVPERGLEAKVTRSLRERILWPEGSTGRAPLPDDVLPGLHFGPGLLGFVLDPHNPGNVTQGKLREQRHERGLDLAAGERRRLRTEDHDGFPQEKADLLRVWEGPAVPLPNNGTESILRVEVPPRKIRGSRRSPAGRRCRDTFVRRRKTCRKWGIRCWAYRGDRQRGRGPIPRLAGLLRQGAAAARAARKAEAVPA